jgi:beta-glucanase (GH16 family)
MHRSLGIVVLSFVIVGGVLTAGGRSGIAMPSESSPQMPGFDLVWSDEFNVDGWPDPRNWTYERGFTRNNELQWYQADNARVQKGHLVIEARRESRPNPAFDSTSTDWRKQRRIADYTSASLTTRGLHSWRYGRFEMRAKIDVRPGMWPAFWTVGDSGRWPASGEIDIMEYYTGKLLANVAWAADATGRAAWDDSRKPLAELGDANWSRRFHVWRMDWDEREIRLYVDGTLLNATDLRETANKDGSGVNPLQQPHHIILNLAVGGTQGGDPSATTFPARYEVDYVRVYARK